MPLLAHSEVPANGKRKFSGMAEFVEIAKLLYSVATLAALRCIMNIIGNFSELSDKMHAN